TSGLSSPRACRSSGLFARLLGRDQPVIYIRHSLRVLLILITGFCCGDRPPATITARRLLSPSSRDYFTEDFTDAGMASCLERSSDVGLLPSPISIRGYDTYPETVKVSRSRKDNRNGQTQGST